MMNALDESEVALLWQMVQREMGIAPEMPEDPVELFREYLADCTADESGGDLGDGDRAELMGELVATLATESGDPLPVHQSHHESLRCCSHSGEQHACPGIGS